MNTCVIDGRGRHAPRKLQEKPGCRYRHLKSPAVGGAGGNVRRHEQRVAIKNHLGDISRGLNPSHPLFFGGISQNSRAGIKRTPSPLNPQFQSGRVRGGCRVSKVCNGISVDRVRASVDHQIQNRVVEGVGVNHGVGNIHQIKTGGGRAGDRLNAGVG